MSNVRFWIERESAAWNREIGLHLDAGRLGSEYGDTREKCYASVTLGLWRFRIVAHLSWKAGVNTWEEPKP